MNTLSRSLKIYIGLLIAFAILTGVNVFMPQGSIFSSQEFPVSKPLFALLVACIMLVLYGGLGFIGLRLSSRLGFTGLWDETVSVKQRLLIPSIIGVGIGIFFILADTVFSKFHSLGPLPHPPFPTSLVASASAGIGEEILFRLFFISFWTWLISHVFLKGKWQERTFRIVVVFSALAFAFAHLPAIMFLLGLKTMSEIPPALMAEIILLNGIVSVFAAYYFRKYGFLSAVSIHFWTDVVWHVLWGLK